MVFDHHLILPHEMDLIIGIQQWMADQINLAFPYPFHYPRFEYDSLAALVRRQSC